MVLKVLSPLFAMCLSALSTGFFTSFASVKLAMLGAQQWAIGFVGSVYYIGILSGSHISAKFILRVGHIRAYVFFAGIIIASSLVQYYFNSAFSWGLSRLTMGYALGSMYLVIESWLVNDAPSNKKGTMISIYTFVLYVGSLCGQVLFKFIDIKTSDAFIIPALLVAISLFPISSTSTRYPAFDLENSSGIGKIVKRAPIEMLCLLISGIWLSTYYVMLPVYLYKIGYGEKDMSLLSMIYLGAICLQYPFGKISDIVERKKVLISMYFASIAIMVLVIIWSLELLGVRTSLFLLGGLAFSTYPISMALACDAFEAKDYFFVIQVVIISYGIGAMIGPMITSFFMQLLGPKALFGFLTLLCALPPLMMFLYRQRVTTDTDDDTKVEFVSPQTTVKLSTDKYEED